MNHTRQEKNKIRCKAYYERNKIRLNKDTVKRQKLRRIKAKDYTDAYKATHPCVDCGESDPIVLEFDHVRGEKTKDISRMRSCNVSLETLENEIAKCDIRCANCHRRMTHKRQQEANAKKRKLPYDQSKNHPSRSCYNRGCRCEECKRLTMEHQREYRKTKKLNKSLADMIQITPE